MVASIKVHWYKSADNDDGFDGSYYQSYSPYDTSKCRKKDRNETGAENIKPFIGYIQTDSDIFQLSGLTKKIKPPIDARLKLTTITVTTALK